MGEESVSPSYNQKGSARHHSGSNSSRKIALLDTTLFLLYTVAFSNPALTQATPDSKQLRKACTDSLGDKIGLEQGADLSECKRSNVIILPLAQAARKRGFAELLNGNAAKADTEFTKSGNYWSLLQLNFSDMALAVGTNYKQRDLLMREAYVANMFGAESYIGRARASLLLDRKNNALTFLHVGLEHNQQSLYWLGYYEPSSPAVGRLLYQRGLFKFLLAELGSERGSRKEACEAFRKSADIGFTQAARWLKTEAGQACPP